MKRTRRRFGPRSRRIWKRRCPGWRNATGRCWCCVFKKTKEGRAGCREIKEIFRATGRGPFRGGDRRRGGGQFRSRGAGGAGENDTRGGIGSRRGGNHLN